MNEAQTRIIGSLIESRAQSARAGWKAIDPVEPLADLVSRRGRAVRVAEVKTISETNEIQQLRFGLGQVLRYAATLRRRGYRDVRPVVIASRRVASTDKR